MSEEIVGYECEGCGFVVEITTWNEGKFECDCEDGGHWHSMTERGFYWNHNGEGFDCDCDRCEKFCNDERKREES